MNKKKSILFNKKNWFSVSTNGKILLIATRPHGALSPPLSLKCLEAPAQDIVDVEVVVTGVVTVDVVLGVVNVVEVLVDTEGITNTGFSILR